MLTVECSPPRQTAPCECCGCRTTTLRGFVYQDGAPHALYYAKFSHDHPQRIVSATVSVGHFEEDALPEERTAFALEIRANERNFIVSVVDAEASPWRNEELIGKTLDRQDALAHSRIQDVFEVSDLMVAEDQSIVNYFAAS
ncbi:MAG: hypothetical protein ACXWCH_33690 [Burkholderiales bacterium]